MIGKYTCVTKTECFLKNYCSFKDEKTQLLNYPVLFCV